MTRHKRMVVLVLAALFAAAPSLALAAQICGACCCSPCAAAPADCGAAVVGTPCCDETLPALPAVAKRALEAPTFQAPAPLRTALPGARGRAASRLHGAPLVALVSPLRLSVVLRI